MPRKGKKGSSDVPAGDRSLSVSREKHQGDMHAGLVKGIVLASVLMLLAWWVFWPVKDNSFVALDDATYIYENPSIRAGLNAAGVRWAFTTSYASNWHPLTWLSHMLDVTLFGVNAGAHHLVNVFWHSLTTVLLFGLFWSMTGLVWHSAILAALFAVHPMHVESVAWAAERKDVLSTFFWFLTMWAYVRYVRAPSTWIYMVVVASFGLGLMSKPMLVTLPFALLLLDWWPLERLDKDSWRQVVVEKLPLFALSGVSCVITYIAQQSGPMSSLITLTERIVNALWGYVMYMAKTFWPTNLAVIYPLPRMPLSPWYAVISAFILAGLTVAVVIGARRHRFLLTGWLWYLGTLVPVIGLVQVGVQMRADRYTYVPLTGLFVILIWGLGRLFGSRRGARAALGMAAACIVLLAWAARLQVHTWRDTITLYTRMVEVTPDHPTPQMFLGNEYIRLQRYPLATVCYEKAVALLPGYHQARVKLAFLYERLGRIDDAITQYKAAVQIDPRDVSTRQMLGVALLGKNLWREALVQFDEVLRLDPRHIEARRMREYALKAGGRAGYGR